MRTRTPTHALTWRSTLFTSTICMSFIVTSSSFDPAPASISTASGEGCCACVCVWVGGVGAAVPATERGEGWGAAAARPHSHLPTPPGHAHDPPTHPPTRPPHPHSSTGAERRTRGADADGRHREVGHDEELWALGLVKQLGVLGSTATGGQVDARFGVGAVDTRERLERARAHTGGARLVGDGVQQRERARTHTNTHPNTSRASRQGGSRTSSGMARSSASARTGWRSSTARGTQERS